MSSFQLILLLVSFYFAFRFFQQINNNSFKKKEDLNNSNIKSIQKDIQEEKNEINPIQQYNIDILLQKANEAFKNENYSDAILHLKDALIIEYNNSDILNRLGLTYSMNKEIDQAIITYQKSLDIDDNDIIHLEVAKLLEEQSLLEQAIYHYQSALKIDDEYAPTHLAYAKLLEKTNKTYEAKEHYRIAYELDPELNKN